MPPNLGYLAGDNISIFETNADNIMIGTITSYNSEHRLARGQCCINNGFRYTFGLDDRSLRRLGIG